MPRYIDADALLLDIQQGIKFGQLTVCEIIHEQPTEDVKPVVRGEWKECEVVQEHGDEPIIDEWQSARCSVCGKYHTTPYMYYFDNFNYCPNCGAEMKQNDGNKTL